MVLTNEENWLACQEVAKIQYKLDTQRISAERGEGNYLGRI